MFSCGINTIYIDLGGIVSMMSWVLVVLFISIILKDVKIIKELAIIAKKRTFEKIFILIAIGVIFYITYAYASIQVHYLLGILGVFLFVANYFKSGITSNGFASMYRSAQFVSWSKIKKVHISKDKNVKVSYSGDGFYHSLYFESKEYDKIIEFLNEKLPNKLISADYDFYIKK